MSNTLSVAYLYWHYPVRGQWRHDSYEIVWSTEVITTTYLIVLFHPTPKRLFISIYIFLDNENSVV